MDPTQLLNGMDNKVYSCTKINGDNQGAIALVGTERGPNTLMWNNTLFVRAKYTLLSAYQMKGIGWLHSISFFVN